MYRQFEHLIKELSPKLHGIAHRMNGHFTFFSDEDLYQEAVIHLWLLFKKGILDDKTDSYILQGCFFYLKNYLRTTLDKAKLISLSEMIDGNDSALEKLIASKSEAGFDHASSALIAEETLTKDFDEREREILKFSIEGLTLREIGSRLGISHVMVIKLKSRIKEKCRILKDSRGQQQKNL